MQLLQNSNVRSILQHNFLVDYQPYYRTKEVSIPKVETLENDKLPRIETTANFQSGFDIFDDSFKKNIKQSNCSRRGLVCSVSAY